MSAADWTEEREAKLKVLWVQGLSCAQIAAQLNKLPGGRLSRNAVIGKRTRIGLPDRADPKLFNRPKHQPRIPRKPRAAISKPKYTLPELKPSPPRRGPPLHIDRPNAVRFIAREPSQCSMFLDGEEGAQGFVCGEPIAINRFCAECASLVYQPVEKRKAA